MAKRPIIPERRIWLKRSVFLISGTLSVLIVGIVIFSGNNESSTFYNDAASTAPDLRPPKNQIGAFFYRRWDPEDNNRSVYSINFENFYSENDKPVISKTALHKVVKIQDFELRTLAKMV